MASPTYEMSSPSSVSRTSHLFRRPDDTTLVNDITSLPRLNEAVCAVNLSNLPPLLAKTFLDL